MPLNFVAMLSKVFSPEKSITILNIDLGLVHARVQ